jgi:hypothetical protein
MSVSIPVQVRGHDENGTPWEEMTSSEDASRGGARFALKKTVHIGQVLQVSLPLPKAYRRFGLTDPSYKVYTLVRDVFPAWPANRVGVMFLGEHPPKGYEQNPGGRYLLPTDAKPAPKERRQYTRLDVFINLKLRRSNADGTSIQEEQTVTENLSRGGARVYTALKVDKGEILEVEDPAGSFSTRVEVRNVFVGKDGVPRLNLRFLDGAAPDKLIAAAGIAGLA